MRTKNSKPFNSIPHAVRPIVMRCNTLSGENRQEYEDLLVGLIDHFKPKTVMQWLNVKKLQDLIWEQARLSRIKPGIMDSIQTEAVTSLLESLPAETQLDLRGPDMDTTMDDLAGRWFWDKQVQKAVNEAFETFHYSGDTIDAVAFVRSARPLARLEKMQESNEVRQLMVSRQLEQEKEVLQLERAATSDDTQEVWQAPPRSAA